MDRITKRLEGFFADLEYAQRQFALRWQKNANRRTIIIIIVCGSIAIATYWFVIRPPDDFPLDQLVTVPSGASLWQVSDTLQQDGIVRSAQAFELLALVTGEGRSLRAGDYMFKMPLDVFSVVHVVSIGAYGLVPVRIRVPEGATTRQMAVIFASQLPRFNQANFLAQAQPLEGYLFPDTYYFLPNATETTVIQTMRQNFDLHIASIQPQIDASGHSLHDIVIMASILELEARTMQDRRMISGLLWNRISKGMPLQVDVTFLYTIGKSTFNLTMKDLTTKSPYNTYVNKGLPPGPIGSPSLSSLLAAATPIKSNYLFYLADSNGITHYSVTYAQQLANERTYLGK